MNLPPTQGFFRYVTASNLHVDETYQRRRKPWLVRRIIGDFNPKALQVLMVSERGDNSLWIKDGGHRWEAVSALDPDYSLPCWVETDDTVQSEAQQFWIGNRVRAALTPRELWKARIESDDVVVLRIRDEVESLGLHLQVQPGLLEPGGIEAFDMLERIFVTQHDELRTILWTLLQAWGKNDRSTFRRVNIASVYQFHRHYLDDYAQQRLIAALKQYAPHQMKALVAQTQLDSRGNPLGRTVLHIYNQTTGKKLMEWSAQTEHNKEREVWTPTGPTVSLNFYKATRQKSA